MKTIEDVLAGWRKKHEEVLYNNPDACDTAYGKCAKELEQKVQELRALAERWDREDEESRKKQAEMNYRLQQGETVTIETTTGGKWLHEKRADELRAWLGPAATPAKETNP